MNLFGTPHANKVSVDEAAQMVEHYLREHGLNPHQQMADSAQGTGWWLTQGTAKVYIFVQGTHSGPVLRITSPILYLPQQNLQSFYRRLLDINADLTNCALATHDNVVLLVAQRPTLGLEQEELDSIVWNVAYVADYLDQKLAAEFGAQMYRQ